MAQIPDHGYEKKIVQNVSFEMEGNFISLISLSYSIYNILFLASWKEG